MNEVKLFLGQVPSGYETIDGGEINITAHLEPEGDGTHEKVVAQAETEGIVLPSGVVLGINATTGVFTPEQEVRIREIVREMIPNA